jgi:hypothetical protein
MHVADRHGHSENHFMLLPRFSLRWLLAATTLCGIVAFVLAQAVRGDAWGIAVAVACGALLMTALVFASVFIVAWSIASVGTGVRKARATSPFATHTPPPQILPPHDPV